MGKFYLSMGLSFLNTISALSSWQKGALLSLIIAVLLWLIYHFATKAIRGHLQKKAYKKENVQNFLLTWRYVWIIVSIILVLIGLSGSLAALGISAAFLGMILGWSLQAPVTGIASWMMIILKRPFKIGDRIIINNIIGDVIDITLTHIVLNQVGGTTVGEEISGRTVMIPNAILFQQIILNYTLKNKYILDEVSVAITYASQFETAETILLTIAQEITKEATEVTSRQPFVRFELFDSGIRLRLRYLVLAKERQRAVSVISKRIVQEFNQAKGIEFAYPHVSIAK
ncbi:MAG: mechanosensitive ion channel [Candidatus Pacebacteria bacterium]|nr:mechanosensitive ion channel [Candidatus Paceibacterota bacterium]